VDWKEAQVIPLFKKKENDVPGHYRPVSLTSVVRMVLESIVRKRVMGHWRANNLLSGCQHGFMSGRSCTTNLMSTLETWTFMIDEGSSVDVIYLDFAKVFDSVPPERLLKKIQALKMEGDILQWIRDFFVGRRQRVSVNGSVSDWAAVKSSVPRDSVLGPVLFVAFINNFANTVLRRCAMYADDTKDHGDRDHLQKNLDALVDWADTWQHPFNADNCNVFHMGKNNE